MTIEIHAPELEALIRERMQGGQNVEDILMQALRLPSTGRTVGHSDWRTMRGMARGSERLTEALMKERAAEKAHDETRIQDH